MGRTCVRDHRPEHSLGDERWLNGCAQCEIDRLVARVERLRGLCKTAIGMLHDADRTSDAEKIHALVGDMEARALERMTPNVRANGLP